MRSSGDQYTFFCLLNQVSNTLYCALAKSPAIFDSRIVNLSSDFIEAI